MEMSVIVLSGTIMIMVNTILLLLLAPIILREVRGGYRKL